MQCSDSDVHECSDSDVHECSDSDVHEYDKTPQQEIVSSMMYNVKTKHARVTSECFCKEDTIKQTCDVQVQHW
jgi:hypothetical protein